MSITSAKTCHHIRVPPDWAHCDVAGRILEVELLSDDKPCQVDEGIRPTLAGTG